MRSNVLTLVKTPGRCFKRAITCSCPRPRGRFCGTSVLDDGAAEDVVAGAAGADAGVCWVTAGSWVVVMIAV